MDDDEDYAFALQFSEFAENNRSFSDDCLITETKKPLSVTDESWELIDPIPDIRQLFIQFDKEYFDGKLACVEVKWSARMTLCAGLCRYEGRGGLCCINLSQPLLKLRPRSDLVNTLLHEMIHALLFVTNNNKDHDAHGPEFHKHMYRINKQSGSKITVYHSFHDEVDLYRQHWWKCEGPCSKRRPFYGIVRRSMNRAPGPNDRWWSDHQKTCGGVFKKIKEPDKPEKKKGKNEKKDAVTKETKGISGKTNSKNIMDFLKKSPNKTSNGNVDKTRSTDSSSEILKTSSFWNGKTITSKIGSFQEIRGKDDSNSPQTFSGSSNNASSNIHGFKMTARKNENETVVNSFSGKGMKMSSSGKEVKAGSTSSSSFASREAFLKKIENGMTKNKGTKRTLDKTKSNTYVSNEMKPKTEKYPKCLNVDKIEQNVIKKEYERIPYKDKKDVLASTNDSSISVKTMDKPKSNVSTEVIFIDDSADDDLLSAIDESILNDSGVDGISSIPNQGLGVGNLVDCPACPAKVSEHKLNEHLDVCLVMG